MSTPGGVATLPRMGQDHTESLELHEAASLAPGQQTAEDGTVLLHIIRPTVGRGKGNHLYEADMLREHAHIFGPHTRPDGTTAPGWKMYLNHLSPQARKAMGGLPRDVRDLGGRIVESWWDPNVPAEGRYGQGAVVGRAKPTPFMRELIAEDPDIVEASISARATSVKPRQHEGKTVYVVEGIHDKGSVDWVTEAGAGGKVVSLLEAAMEEQEAAADLSNLSDPEFLEYLRGERPQLAEALGTPPAPEDNQEDDMGLTHEMLTEALADETFAEVLDNHVKALVEEAVIEATSALPAAIAEVLEGEREVIRAEARADADRSLALRDMRDAAHEQINEALSRLPEDWRAEARSRFDLTESGPTEGLDVVDEVNEDGEIVKTAREVLTESVSEEIARQRALYASANPARVRGQGTAVVTEDGEDAPAKQRDVKGTKYGSLLAEANIDPTTAWAAE